MYHRLGNHWAALHKRKGGFMALELYIDSESWAESVDGDIAASLLDLKSAPLQTQQH
ncbi:hypothetical protein R3P38DRAFT_3245413 [Favolaschia claudopus]|uniref:Uncharacterized protein n=1 Tax=Favolaschia claudopus TaxID=2862362 RepID=A0AAV9Z0B0_9AGAR